MSMSTHVVGFKPVDAKWKAMRDVYVACKAAKIDLPREVEKFFEDGAPDDNGVRVDLDKYPCVRQWDDVMSKGLEIDLSKLPADVKIIRFFNSW